MALNTLVEKFRGRRWNFPEQTVTRVARGENPVSRCSFLVKKAMQSLFS